LAIWNTINADLTTPKMGRITSFLSPSFLLPSICGRERIIFSVSDQKDSKDKGKSGL